MRAFSSGLIVSDGARKTCITPVKKADWEAGVLAGLQKGTFTQTCLNKV
jgi:hypothetical protein